MRRTKYRCIVCLSYSRSGFESTHGSSFRREKTESQIRILKKNSRLVQSSSHPFRQRGDPNPHPKHSFSVRNSHRHTQFPSQQCVSISVKWLFGSLNFPKLKYSGVLWSWVHAFIPTPLRERVHAQRPHLMISLWRSFDNWWCGWLLKSLIVGTHVCLGAGRFSLFSSRLVELLSTLS